MNLQEILDLTMEQAGLDVDDLDEHRTRLIHYVNDGYMRLMLGKYRPWTEETVPVSGGAVAFERLARVPLEAMGAEQAGAALACTVREDARRIEMPGAADGEAVLRYRYRPQKLEFDTDAPRLPEWVHGALADWAAWKLLSGGNQSKQQRAQPFRMAFEETFARLKPFVPDEAFRKRFVNLYR